MDEATAVVVNSPEIPMAHENSPVDVMKRGQVDHRCGEVQSGDGHGSRAPIIIGVIGFIRSERCPPDVGAAIDPRNSARVPAVWDGPGTGHDDGRHHRRSPIPAPAAVDEEPVAVVVRGVAEGLIRDPALIPIIGGPSPIGVRGPLGPHPGGSPELAVLALVLHPLPPSVFLELIGVVIELGRKVSRRIALDFESPGPEAVTLSVPVVELGVHQSLACCYGSSVGEERRGSRLNLVASFVA